jgi:hypothetical protein
MSQGCIQNEMLNIVRECEGGGAEGDFGLALHFEKIKYENQSDERHLQLNI